ncbi:MAG TPA: DNA recombination protein RmuC [Syntrophomonadaceae bacterium]|nr:DNA recombination protein RmuC [Syntrophomonadaceae bacterium]
MDYLLPIMMLGLIVISLFIVVQLRSVSQQQAQLDQRLALLEKSQENAWAAWRADLSALRTESAGQARQGREELSHSLRMFEDSLLSQVNQAAHLQKSQLGLFGEQIDRLASGNEARLEQMRVTVENRLKELQEDNNQKLEKMRQTVDEKLHTSLETRLGESFKLVSDRLEMVHKGLGEMQSLAAGVGDLKKVLTNVKTRGIWGEIQLGNILEQVLSPEQYACNVVTRPGSNERVEFAIRLPGQNQGEGEIWLPIDAKFPQEDYLRLIEASEQGLPEKVEEAGRQLEKRIRAEARMVQEKYLAPPYTTDFGIIFLPTESLYAEVVRRPGFLAALQNELRVLVTGPSTMVALLNSLSVGFRTLIIEQRTSEVWDLLGAVKSEFGNFGDILDKTKKKLQEASNTIDSASRRSRNIEKKLRAVQELPLSGGMDDMHP